MTPMRKLDLHVETLACEVDDAYLVEEVMAQEGVLAADVDLQAERVAISYDENLVSKASILQFLRFFGLTPAPVA